MKKIILPLILSLLLTGCSSVIFSNRSRTLLISPRRMASLGLKAYSEVKTKSKISHNKEMNEQLIRVGKKLAATAEDYLKRMGKEELLRNLTWEFAVIDDDKTINAFVLPGGKVVMYSAIYKLFENDDDLAVVVSHELAHALAQHGNERMSQQMMVNMGGLLLSQLTASNDKQTRELYGNIYGIGATVGVILPYSRTHETEADRIGLILMAAAGYDPHAAVSFWQKMSKTGGKRTPEFLSTHPVPETRIKDIKEYIPKALEYARI